ncbi:hypothetical protein [Hyphobacterium sp.]|uniref:hypothetical protein n=1 Tax=Hyphobacterium sp. TaxID=2004662 RepID=UPI003BAC564B
MRKRPPLSRQLLYVALIMIVGIVTVQALAWYQNPPIRCVEAGGTWHWDGRWCEEAETSED